MLRVLPCVLLTTCGIQPHLNTGEGTVSFQESFCGIVKKRTCVNGSNLTKSAIISFSSCRESRVLCCTDFLWISTEISEDVFTKTWRITEPGMRFLNDFNAQHAPHITDALKKVLEGKNDKQFSVRSCNRC